MKWNEEEGEKKARGAKLKYSKRDLDEFMEGRLFSTIQEAENI